MKVKELIRVLEAVPQDTPLFVGTYANPEALLAAIVHRGEDMKTAIVLSGEYYELLEDTQ